MHSDQWDHASNVRRSSVHRLYGRCPQLHAKSLCRSAWMHDSSSGRALRGDKTLLLGTQVIPRIGLHLYLRYKVHLYTIIITFAKMVMFSSLFVSLLATLHKDFRADWHEIFREGWKWAMIKYWWRSESPSGYRDCFPDSSLFGDTESGTVSTDCAARRCSARHALAGIAIATVTSLRHRPTTDSHGRRALVEVCPVPVLLVQVCYRL